MNFVDAIQSSWSSDTAHASYKSKWTKENPSCGQCAVTAMLLQDKLGGLIKKVKVKNKTHYFNVVDNRIIDLTSSQFSGIHIDYKKGESVNRKNLDKNEDVSTRYLVLLNAVSKKMN